MTDDVNSIFTCSICWEIFRAPVSLPCGHTFCKKCLKVALTMKPHCPTCRAHVSPFAFQCAENQVISQYISAKFPQEDTSAQIENVSLKTWSGSLFRIHFPLVPNQFGRLNIFEPRYICLYERAMAGDRMFAFHPEGMAGQMGLVVTILESQQRHTGIILCTVEVVHRCRFLEDARASNSDDALVRKVKFDAIVWKLTTIRSSPWPSQLGLHTVSVEIVEDEDSDVLESSLSQGKMRYKKSSPL